MAKNSNILLAALALAAGFFFSKDSDSKKEEEAKKEAAKKETAKKEAEETAKKALEDAANKYESNVIISDITMQFFSDGYPHNALIVHQFPYNYIVWARFRNDSDIPVQIDITDIVVTILHTTNSKKLPINKNNFVIPAKSETQWLPIMVLAEQIIAKNKFFNDTVIVNDIKSYFPRIFNFFVPAHFVVKYNVKVPNQDTILAKDVMYEADTEALSLPTTKGQSGWFDFSTDVWNKAYAQYYTNGFSWVEPANKSYVDDSHVNPEKGKNMLNPSNNPSYLSYLYILRDRNNPIKFNPYKGYPSRYMLLRDYEQNTASQVPYTYYDYQGGKTTAKSGKVMHPYMGIVYDNKGYVAYE